MSLNYSNKEILAPMVRVGTLPMRLLALEYGADIVYSEEIIDKKIIACAEPVKNEYVNAVEYRIGNSIVFSTCDTEREKVVIQIGTSDPVLALKAALKVHNHVAGIDINMGCPKHFSLSGGMGAALLRKPDTVRDILTTLVRNVNRPITCKIRILEKRQDTIQLVKMIEQTGVSALAVHCRLTAERPRDPAHWEELAIITSEVKTIPIIANGDIFTRENIKQIKEKTGVSSVMLARGAQDNVSIFRKEGLLAINEVAINYLFKALEKGNVFQNSKYTLLQMYKALMHKRPEGGLIQNAKSYDELCKIWDVNYGDYGYYFNKNIIKEEIEVYCKDSE